MILGILSLLAVLVTLTITATTANAATCTPTGFFRDAINMTAAQINPPGTVSGEVDATGCNIGVYYDTGIARVKNADIHGANYFGVLVNGDVNDVQVEITKSQIHNIGETPFNGTQHGNAIYLRAFGTGEVTGKIEGNQISLYQKGGIIANGAGTNVKIKNNTVTGLGPVNFIAQNGIQVGFGATGTVTHNSVTGNAYSGANFAASGGILIVGGPCYGLPEYTSGVKITGNTLVGNDVGVYLSNLDENCLAPAVATGIKVHGNKISNDAVTNTTGNGPAAYQAGISDVGNGDEITGNKICGAGYDPANQPTGGYVNWIDSFSAINPLVQGNKICGDQDHDEHGDHHDNEDEGDDEE